jgi:hypothetical protein
MTLVRFFIGHKFLLVHKKYPTPKSKEKEVFYIKELFVSYEIILMMFLFHKKNAPLRKIGLMS